MDFANFGEDEATLNRLVTSVVCQPVLDLPALANRRFSSRFAKEVPGLSPTAVHRVNGFP